MSARLFSALSFSMAVHLVLWSGLFGGGPLKPDRSRTSLFENSVFIDPAAMEAVRKAKAKAKAAEAKAVRAPAAPKKTEAPPPAPPKKEEKPSSAAPPSPAKATVAPPSSRKAEFAAAVAKMPDKAVRVTPLPAKAGAPAETAGTVQKTGADLMANPETRGLFADYFGDVKGRIQRKLREKCAGRNIGRGSVDLAFILLADGRLHKVYVMDHSSNADPQLKQLAIESLRESAPFVDFPPDFKARQIAFNLTVYFDDL